MPRPGNVSCLFKTLFQRASQSCQQLITSQIKLPLWFPPFKNVEPVPLAPCLRRLAPPCKRPTQVKLSYLPVLQASQLSSRRYQKPPTQPGSLQTWTAYSALMITDTGKGSKTDHLKRCLLGIQIMWLWLVWTRRRLGEALGKLSRYCPFVRDIYIYKGNLHL